MYLNDAEIKEELRKKGKYKKTIEKSPQSIRNPRILPDERNWLAVSEEGLERAKSIGMEERRIEKDGQEKKEFRYYISKSK